MKASIENDKSKNEITRDIPEGFFEIVANMLEFIEAVDESCKK